MLFKFRNKIKFILFASILFFANQVFSSNENDDTIIYKFPRFELKKPFIGCEVMGPSFYLPLIYEQQFFSIGKNNFFDYQVLINNKQSKDSYYNDYEFEQISKVNKFAIYLINRTQLTPNIGLGLGFGYLHFQKWDFTEKNIPFGVTEFTSKFTQNDFLILKGYLSTLFLKKFLLKFNIHYIFNDKLVAYDKYRYAWYDEYSKHEFSNFDYSVSLSYFLKNKKNKDIPYSFKRNELSYNFAKSHLGYEFFLYSINNLNISTGAGITSIPFKRYGENSYKKGWFLMSDALININYSLSNKTYSFIGARLDYYNINFYIFDTKYNINNICVSSNIGLSFKLYKNLNLKIAYTPYIYKKLDANFEYFQTKTKLLILNNIDFTVGYAFGK